MSGDNLDLKLNFDIGTKGEEKLDKVDKTIARMTANIERLVAAAKAAGGGLNSILGQGNRGAKSGSSADTRNATRALRDQLGIDREKLRVAKMAMRFRQNEATQAIKAAQAQERQARQAFRDKLTFNSRLAAHRLREDNAALRAVRTEQRAVERSFRQKMAFATRIANQRSREEAAAEREIQRGLRETSRLRQAEQRRALSDSRALQRERSRGISQIGRGAGRVRDGGRTAIGVGAAAGAAAAYTGQRAVRAVTNDAVELDDAMNRNARMQPELGGPKLTGPLMRQLREKYQAEGRKLNKTSTELLNARAEVLQAGVSNEIADQVTFDISKFSSINGLDASQVAEQFGYGISALSAQGEVTEQRVSKLVNTMQYLAANTPASRQQMASFTKRGLGAGAAMHMRDEDVLAYGASATSAGADGETAARMLSSDSMKIARHAADAPDLMRKSHKSEQDRRLIALPARLGFGSWDNLKQSMDVDAGATYEKIYDAVGAIKNPMEKLALLKDLFGENFGVFHANMAESGSFRKMRQAVRNPEAIRALEAGMEELRTTLGWAILSITNTFRELSATFGMTLKPLWRDLSDWVSRLNVGFDNFKLAFQGGVEGLLTGLGSKDGSLASLLNETFGSPEELKADVYSIFQFARGFGEGIKTVITSVKAAFTGVASMFGGSDPKALGKLVAEFIGFATVLTIAAPVVMVLGALSRGILGLVEMIVGSFRLIAGLRVGAAVAGAAGGVGGLGAGAAAAGAAGAATKGAGILGKLGGVLGIFGLAEGANALGALQMPDGSKKGGWGRGIVDFLDPGVGSRIFGDNPKGSAGDPFTDFAKRVADDAERELKLLQEGNDKTQELIDQNKAKAVEDKSKQIRDEEKRKLDTMLTGIRNPAMSGSVGSGSSTADDLRARGFNVVSPNTTPNGANGNMPRAQGGDNASPDQKSGGSRSWRNNNPGNIEYGPFARSMGAIGTDGRFAKFPSYEAGRKAQEKLLFESKGYRDLTLSGAIRRWAPASENNVPAYLRAMGGDPGKRMSEYTPEQRGRLLDAMQAHEGWRTGTVAGGGSGGSPVAAGTTDGRSVPRMTGTLTMDGQTYQYGSGGHRGANSIPAGVYPITPNAIGPWGRQHGAIGLNGNRIWDSALGRFREGIEMHSASSASMLSAGCLAINKQQWAQFRQQTLDFVKRNGKAYLKVDSNGNASITADDPRQADNAQAGVKKTADLAKGLNKAPTAGKGGLGEIDVAPPMKDQWGNQLGQNTPTRSGSGGLGQNTPTRNGPGGRNGDAGSGGGVNVHGPIHINVPGAGDPKQVATAVNTAFRANMMGRMHDIDPTAV